MESSELLPTMSSSEEKTISSSSSLSSSVYDNVPFKKLQYVIGQCNYGGRVTDDKDRRLIGTILPTYFTPAILRDRACLSSSGTYFVPSCQNTMNDDNDDGNDDGNDDDDVQYSDASGEDREQKGKSRGGRSSGRSSVEVTQETYLSYIRSLPLNAQPEVFQMHPNASITKEKSDTQCLFDCMLLVSQASPTPSSTSEEEEEEEGTSSSSSPSVNSADSIVDVLACSILGRLPNDLDVMARNALLKYPVSYGESMNTVICQELSRFSHLISIMEQSLIDVRKALKGKRERMFRL